MSQFDYPPCTMTSQELDQASRAHFEFTAHLLKEIKARRAVNTQSTSTAQSSSFAS